MQQLVSSIAGVQGSAARVLFCVGDGHQNVVIVIALLGGFYNEWGYKYDGGKVQLMRRKNETNLTAAPAHCELQQHSMEDFLVWQ